MTIEQLNAVLDRRNKMIEEQRALWDLADTEDRSLDAADEERSDRMTADIETADAKIRNISERMKTDAAVIEARNLGNLTGDDRDVDNNDNNDDSGIGGELRSMIAGERGSVHIPFETRALSGKRANVESGGALVPEMLYGQIYEQMQETSMILQYAEVIETSGGEPMKFPKETGDSESSRTAEGQEIQKSDPSPNMMSLGADKQAFIVQVPRELEQDSAFNVEAWVRRQGGRALGRGSNKLWMVGEGTGEIPNGVMNAETGKTTAAADAVTMDELISVQHSVLSVQRSAAVWMFHDSTIESVRKLKDGNGDYIWQRSTQAGVPDILLGNPSMSDPHISPMGAGNKFGVFGDMSGFYIRIAGGFIVERSIHSSFENDLIDYRFIVRIDSDIQDTTGIRTVANAA